MAKRCHWVENSFDLYIEYHDQEWGVPVHEDKKLFEFLILEGAQAGLSWSTILKKREGYREAFADWDVNEVSKFDEKRILELMNNRDIVRNQLKIRSSVTNAQCFIKVIEQYGTFANFLWGFVDGKPIINQFKNMGQVPAKTDLSDTISKDLKQKGFKFVGSTIIYAYMQAVGLVNDHTVDCFRSPVFDG
ncbi:MAG: DNA-3-methyladenine glycosylase [Cyclobacteriaceae bacterium]|nr:MAG: DNA-3-methyladenine glycosylase [Cyclobacteriaceae bacterium]